MNIQIDTRTGVLNKIRVKYFKVKKYISITIVSPCPESLLLEITNINLNGIYKK